MATPEVQAPGALDEERAAVAQRIAAEVRRAHAHCLMSKVTSLGHVFRAKGTGVAGALAVTAELEKLDIYVRPEIRAAGRAGCVELYCDEASDASPATPLPDESIVVSEWRPDAIEEERPFLGEALPAMNGVLWFNVEPLEEPRDDFPQCTVPAPRGRFRRSSVPRSPASSSMSSLDAEPGGRTPEMVFKRLTASCPGLTSEMVIDLLSTDAQPKVETYGDESGVRGVSTFAMIARTRPTSAGISDAYKELVFQPVEFLVGEGWIITCWQHSRVFNGAGQPQRGTSVLREPFLGRVRHRWRNDPGTEKTSGDLGMYLARSLVDTCGASHRMLERWVEAWEMSFYGRLGIVENDAVNEATTEISNVLSMVGEFRRRLTAFSHARWWSLDKSWFPNVSDPVEHSDRPAQNGQVAALRAAVDATEGDLDLLFQTIRADMDLLLLRSVGTQQESSERLHRQLAKVTALLLVPTLVGGIFGANTATPGGATWFGFELMIVLMIASSGVVYAVLRKDFH